VAQQTLVSKSLLIIKTSRSQSDTPYSVGLLCTNDHSDAETSTWQHATLTTNKHPCSRRDSKPHSQQEIDCRPTP